jgi:hypothetical protein
MDEDKLKEWQKIMMDGLMNKIEAGPIIDNKPELIAYSGEPHGIFTFVKRELEKRSGQIDRFAMMRANQVRAATVVRCGCLQHKGIVSANIETPILDVRLRHLHCNYIGGWLWVAYGRCIRCFTCYWALTLRRFK